MNPLGNLSIEGIAVRYGVLLVILDGHRRSAGQFFISDDATAFMAA